MPLPGHGNVTDFNLAISINIGDLGLGVLSVASLPQAMRPLLSAEPVVDQFTPPAQLFEPIGIPPFYSWADIPQNQQYLDRMREKLAVAPCSQDSDSLWLCNPDED